MAELAVEIDIPHTMHDGVPRIFGGQTKQKLDVICKSKGITLSNAHSALGDTKATVELFKRHINDAHTCNLFTFDDLKSTKRTYKFISSWKNGIPILQYSKDGFDKIQIVQKTNRTRISPVYTSDRNESFSKLIQKLQMVVTLQLRFMAITITQKF